MSTVKSITKTYENHSSIINIVDKSETDTTIFL